MKIIDCFIINNEIEMEAEAIVSIQRKIDEAKVEAVIAEQKRQEKLQVLESQLTEAQGKFSFYNSEISSMTNVFNEIQKNFGIGITFKLITFVCQFLFDQRIIFDDTIMYHADFSI